MATYTQLLFCLILLEFTFSSTDLLPSSSFLIEYLVVQNQATATNIYFDDITFTLKSGASTAVIF